MQDEYYSFVEIPYEQFGFYMVSSLFKKWTYVVIRGVVGETAELRKREINRITETQQISLRGNTIALQGVRSLFFQLWDLNLDNCIVFGPHNPHIDKAKMENMLQNGIKCHMTIETKQHDEPLTADDLIPGFVYRKLF